MAWLDSGANVLLFTNTHGEEEAIETSVIADSTSQVLFMPTKPWNCWNGFSGCGMRLCDEITEPQCAVVRVDAAALIAFKERFTTFLND